MLRLAAAPRMRLQTAACLLLVALLALPTTRSFSLVSLPRSLSLARSPAPGPRHSRQTWRTPILNLRSAAAASDSEAMGRCAAALCAAGDEIVAAAAILGENQCDEEDPARLSAGGCSIANAGRDAEEVAAALRDNEWVTACGPLKACAGSLFGAAASLADVCGAALGEAGLEIEDASLVLPATAGPSLTSAGESLASAGGALGAHASEMKKGGGVYAQAGARLFLAGGSLAAAGEALEQCGVAVEKGGN